MIKYEEVFLKKFISNVYQDKALAKLNSKKRKHFLGSLYKDNPILNSNLTWYPIATDYSDIELKDELLSHADIEPIDDCYCISYYSDIDKTNLKLDLAIKYFLEASMVTLIIINENICLMSFEQYGTKSKFYKYIVVLN